MKYLPIALTLLFAGSYGAAGASAPSALETPQQQTSTAGQPQQSLDAFIATTCHPDQVNGDAKKEAAFAACARSQAKVFDQHLAIQIALSKLPSGDIAVIRLYCKVDEAGWEAVKKGPSPINKASNFVSASRKRFKERLGPTPEGFWTTLSFGPDPN